MRKPKENTTLKKLRTRIAKAPAKPGTYRWLDQRGDVLYVGKAKNLRNRLRSYLPAEALAKAGVQKPDSALGPWKQALLRHIADFDYTVTRNELEALVLETNMIKKLQPKYNVLMKDDKNYVYVRMTVEDPYPTVSVTRQMEEKHARPNGSAGRAKYFGPYLSARDTHATLDMLNEIFHYRACRASIEALNAGKTIPGKPCLEHQIGKCNGLCAGVMSAEKYLQAIEGVLCFLRGDRGAAREHATILMKDAAEKHQFERAAKLRDTLHTLKAQEERQIVSDTTGGNSDTVGIALYAGHAQVVILKERDGRIIAELSFPLKGQAEDIQEVLGQFLPQYFSNTQDIPETIVIAEDFDERATFEEWLSGKRGARVAVHIPERGKKSKLLLLAEENAEEKVRQQLAKWETEQARVDIALVELQSALGLPALPRRIECYDISHLGGTETVGSMVVFLEGKAKSDHYRSFTLRTIRKGEIDDYKALQEVLLRRLRHLMQTEERWKAKGITCGRARKVERPLIRDILEEHAELFHDRTLTLKDTILVARENEAIVGFGRLVQRSGGIRLIKSVWIAETHRGRKLGHMLVKKLLAQAKTGKVYVTIQPVLEEYYAQLGFRHIEKVPSSITEAMQQATAEDPNVAGGIVMMAEVVKSKPDPSLTDTPDLFVLDGGKGQLGVGLEALRASGLTIPIVALAKREEEIFTPESPTPLALPESSEARFLLMRLRDEAHRSANRHRERRWKKTMVT